MNGALDHSDQPDPDAIKMFVGQIPRSWSEKELKELFEPYGAVYQINVLRDRSQNPPQSKGTDGGGRARAGWGRPGRGASQEGAAGAPAPRAAGSAPRPRPRAGGRAAGEAGGGAGGRREGGGAAAPGAARARVTGSRGHFGGRAGRAPVRGAPLRSSHSRTLPVPCRPLRCSGGHHCVSLFPRPVGRLPTLINS